MTFWLEPKPFVFVFDIELGREAFKRNEFAGRPSTYIGRFISNEKHTDVEFADYGPQWESLRRVAHAAVRKYAVSDELAYLVCDIVDDTVKTIIEKEGINKPFNPFTTIYLTFFNILAQSAFGKRYAVDDPEFLMLKYYMSDFNKETGDAVAFIEFFPILRPFFWKINKDMEIESQKLINLLKEKYSNHMKDYSDGIIRDFCDS